MAAKAPHPLEVFAEHIPAELTVYPQWVGWRYAFRQGNWTKVPINPETGHEAKSNDPRTWTPFERALARAQRDGLDGIGFVFTTSDLYAGVDLDRCRHPETGQLAPWAEEIVASSGSYTEVSPSGTGVKSFVRANIPRGGNRRGQIELYDHGRYFTVTGHHVAGTPPTIEARQSIIETLHARLFPTPLPAQRSFTDDRRPRRGTKVLADDALVAQVMAARNGMQFTRLWHGDISGYPSHSEADLALCALLAYWCGPDPERIDRLFQQSKLDRAKWHRRHYADGRTHGATTIALALTRRECPKAAVAHTLDRLAIRPANSQSMALFNCPSRVRCLDIPSRPHSTPLEGS